jgi:hypothetical protein
MEGCEPMSFLKSLPITGGIGAALNPNKAAEGLGHLLNVSPLGISNFANTVGNVANGIANAGGAPAGYDGSAAPINNHLQMLDPEVLRTIMAKFQPGSAPPLGAYR